jgi:predicted HTH transcriptional regulator
VAWVWFSKREKEFRTEARRMEKEIQIEREIWYGFSEFNEKLLEIKEQRKGKIMNVMEKGAKMSTHKAADLLDISRTSAFRYLEELQKEGSIEQVGASGRGVDYKIKQK